MNTKVTVIIPIYNVGKYILRCAKSLFEQTLEDIEFLFINDCTPDNSMDILDSVIKEYNESLTKKRWTVRLFNMPVNCGQAAVRKVGIQEAKGEYIIHCDSDDWVDPMLYQRLYEKAKNGNIDIVWCGYYRVIGGKQVEIKDNKQRFLMQGPLWNKLVKRELFESDFIFPIANKAEDGAIMTQVSYKAQSRAYIDLPLYYYVDTPESICGKIDESSCLVKLKQECQNVDLKVSFLLKHGCVDSFKKDIILWKYTARNNLLPLLREKKYRDLWKNTYPEIEMPFLLCNKFSIKEKLGYLSKRLGWINFQ